MTTTPERATLPLTPGHWVVDTNHSPDGISYVVPGNDDSSRAIRLYARGMADAILEGRNQSVEEVAAASRDEFVEVEEEEEGGE